MMVLDKYNKISMLWHKHLASASVGGVIVVATIICLFLPFVSCYHDPVEMGSVVALNIELLKGDDFGEIKSKGAVDDFYAKVILEYEKDTFEFECFFTDIYNTGSYTIDQTKGDCPYGVHNAPFKIVVETEIDGASVRGESEMIVVSEEAVITVRIELKAGFVRIGTRSPRFEDIAGRYAFVGGEIYELGTDQQLRESGVICIPQVAYDAMQSKDQFSFENDGLDQISGYSRTFSEYDNSGSGRSNYRFELRLSSLTPETNYSIRAYALVGDEYHYGRVVNFRTKRQGPDIRTLMATNITKTSVKLKAQILTDDGSDIVERGFIVSTSANFENPQKYECGSGLGDISADVTGLSPCTRLFYKSYATNTDGLYYGSRMSVCTYDEFTDSRDNNVYRYVQIGSQYWMAENLRFLTKVDGATTGSEIDSLADEAFSYIYGYNGTDVLAAQGYTTQQAVENVSSGTDVYNTFGVLYNFTSATDACPSGWHLPTDSEWTRMEIYLQNAGFNSGEILDNDANRLTNNYTAKALSSGTLWSSSSYENTVGNDLVLNNASCFSALPGGSRGAEGDFYGVGRDAYWWTKTSAGNGKGYCRTIGYTNDGMKREIYSNGNGLSVRCVKD